MNTEQEIIDQFIGYLTAGSGYPKASIVSQAALKSEGEAFRPNLIILSPETSGILAIVEFKRGLGRVNLDAAKQQLQRYQSAISQDALLFFIHVPDEKNGYQYYRLEEDEWVQIPVFPDYQTLSAFQRAKLSKTVAKETIKQVDQFKVTSFVISGIAGVLLVLSFFKIISVTKEELILFAVAAVMAVLPFAAKIKALGVEFERQQQERDSKK